MTNIFLSNCDLTKFLYTSSSHWCWDREISWAYDMQTKIIDTVEIIGDYRFQPRYSCVSMERQSGRLNSETRTVGFTEMQIWSHQIKLTTTKAPVVHSRSGNVNRNARNMFSETIKRCELKGWTMTSRIICHFVLYIVYTYTCMLYIHYRS